MIGGYFFVIIEYNCGRSAVHAKKYKTYASAQRQADRLSKRKDVKRSYVGYQYGIDNDVDLKAFV